MGPDESAGNGVTAPSIPAGYGAVLTARAEVVAALDELAEAQDRLEAAIQRAARAENAHAGYRLPEPAPLG